MYALPRVILVPTSKRSVATLQGTPIRAYKKYTKIRFWIGNGAVKTREEG